MSALLQRLTDTVAGWDASRAAERDACAAALASMERNMEQAIALWQECSGDTDAVENKYTAIIAVGAERAKALHRLHLEQKDAAAAITDASGVALKDSLGIVDEVDIVQPYGQFAHGESVGARADAAIATLEARRDALKAAIARL